jgi:O-antigen/teichoic acid export membrane protein
MSIPTSDSVQESEDVVDLGQSAENKQMKHSKPFEFRSRVLKGGAQLIVAKGITQVCSFFRNIIVARIIGVDNFGIAATFSVTVSVLDMLGNLSVDKLLVQAHDGDDDKLQSAGHALQALRGAVSAVLMFVIARPMANLFGIPQAAWAFRFIALIPVLRGLMHLDQQRVQRDMNYRGLVGLEIAQQIITTLLAWPLSVWLRDYSVMLWLLLLQYAVPTVGSFIIARRPYRWHWDAALIARFYRFGWPLILNGLLVFGVFQGDRFLIGSANKLFGTTAYSIKDLGIYSLGMSLTLIPALALSNISGSLMFPVFSRLQSSRAQLSHKYAVCSQGIFLLGGLMSLPFVIMGGKLVTVIYGAQYSYAGTFVGWLAAMQMVRMGRLAPTTAAMAFGDNRNALFANVARSVALVVTCVVVAKGAPLKWVALSALLGETAGLIVCIRKLEHDHHIPADLEFKPALITTGYVALMGFLAAVFLTHSSMISCLATWLFSSILFVVTMLLAFPTLKAIANRKAPAKMRAI